ncbi:MAG: type II toxin-antitoxin system HicB family antitoxin [Chloroflexi bacterium]|nr:type II toxin-antitoxin system HicB family antitoxin [Chloroflexota bacterium]
MLTAYIRTAMQMAQYKILDDGRYFGEIAGFQGVWASEDALEECRRVLQEVLEEWLLLKLRDNEEVPELEGITLSSKAIKA